MDVYIREILSYSRCFRESFHCCHLSCFSFGSGVSHSLISLEISLKMERPSILTGTANLSGSYKLLMTTNTPHLVKGLSLIST